MNQTRVITRGPHFTDSPHEVRTFYNMAVAALQAGDWKKARGIFADLAERGHLSATFNLGLMHMTGRSEELDVDRGVELMAQAQALGHVEARAFISLADRFEHGIPEGTSVARMIAEAGGDFPDVILIRALAASLSASMDQHEVGDYWFVEIDQLRHSPAGLAFLKLNDWAHFGLQIFKKNLAEAKGGHGEVCSASIAQTARVLSQVFGWSEGRIMFIRCSIAALVWNGAGQHPSISRLQAPGLAFYERA